MEESATDVLASPVIRVGAAWITSSVVLSTYSNTAFLKAADNDAVRGLSLLGLVQQIFVSAHDQGGNRLYSFRLNREALLSPSKLITAHAKTYALSALSLLSANLFNSMALKSTGITITYVTKCGIPIFTSLLCLLGFGPPPSKHLASIISLGVLCAGIAMASSGNSSFHLAGFIFALVSSISQSFLTVFSKQASDKSGVSGPQAQFIMATLGIIGLQVGQVIRTIVGLASEQQTRMPILPVQGETPQIRKRLLALAPLGTLAAVAGYMEYSLNFGFISLVTPSFAAVVDGVRRAGIVTAGNLMFAEAPLSRMNHAGILLAISGGVAYSLSTKSSPRVRPRGGD